MDAKRELARRLMKGNGVPQNHPIAVALLEDCVTLGDTDAMLLLAKRCAFGHGMEHNAERAEALISDAAEKGNDEALSLMKLLTKMKKKKDVYLWSLLIESNWRTTSFLFVNPYRTHDGRIHF